MCRCPTSCSTPPATTGCSAHRISPATFDRDQRLSLEGDFDTYFSLYCPEGYERDALYLFTPDIMARFIDNAAALDVEIVDDWLFLYAKTDLSTLNPAMWAWLFSCVAALLTKLDQWARWRDDRLAQTPRAGGSLAAAAMQNANTMPRHPPPPMLPPPTARRGGAGTAPHPDHPLVDLRRRRPLRRVLAVHADCRALTTGVGRDIRTPCASGRLGGESVVHHRKEDAMKAVQYRSIGEGPEVVEIDIPEPGPGQIRLKVTAAGLCHSDWFVMDLPEEQYTTGCR